MLLTLQILGLVCMAIYSVYTVLVYWCSRKPRNLTELSSAEHSNQQLKHNYIFLVPGINEGQVIGDTIDNLLSLDEQVKVVFVDDASSDNSAQIVDELTDLHPQRVFRLRRDKPRAQHGKGEALNWAVRRLSRLRIVNDDSLIVVFDADGRSDRHLLLEADRAFSESDVMAAQARVRMRITGYQSLVSKLLLLNQDLEFHIVRGVQLLRERFYCVGMGGNGQFFRWSYVNSVIQRGEEVWPDCLLEDFASGLKILLNEKSAKMVFLENEVNQQGVHNPVKFIKQRTRWALGGYQNITKFGEIWRASHLPKGAKLDLSYFVFQMPFNSILIVSSVGASLFFIINLFNGLVPLWFIPLSAAASLVLPLIWSLSYLRENPEHRSELSLLILSMPLYFFLMMFSTLHAWLKLIRRDYSWTKTARVNEIVLPVTRKNKVKA